MQNFTYIIIDDNENNGYTTKVVGDNFNNLTYVKTANNAIDGLKCCIENNPDIVFLEINLTTKVSNISLNLINEINHSLHNPKIIITSKTDRHCFDAIKHGVFDYLISPITKSDLKKTLLRLEKEYRQSKSIQLEKNQQHLHQTSKENCDFTNQNPQILCIKSYGDYRYVNINDICYLSADNNSTDIHLNNDEVITAFKTLKLFETALKKPFERIHNSYIINTNYISRIQTGNSICYIKNKKVKIPFSKSYRKKIDEIINDIASGNYFEI